MIKLTLLATVLLLLANNVAAFSYTLELSEKDVQVRVEEKMPIEKKKYFITVIVSNPKIEFSSASEKIGIDSDIQVKLPGGFVSNGEAYIEGGVTYKSKQGEFFLIDSEVKKVSFDKLPKKFEADVIKIVDLTTKKVLGKTPVYKFKDNNLKHKLAKSTLKSVHIKNGMLALELGI